jgi:hypothetical protein
MYADNLYFKKVIKQLSIEDVLPDISSTRKQDVASNEGGPATEVYIEQLHICFLDFFNYI